MSGTVITDRGAKESIAFPRRFENALPSDLFDCLEAEIATLRSAECTFWLPLGSSIHTSLAAAVEWLALHVGLLASAAGVELWLRSKPASEAMAAHLDKDESLSRSTGQIRHPAFASVLYLNDIGGETFVRRMTRDGVEEVFLSVPRRNAFLCFPGDMAHGVLVSERIASEDRVSLLLNWWDEKPHAPGCMELPKHRVAGRWLMPSPLPSAPLETQLVPVRSRSN